MAMSSPVSVQSVKSEHVRPTGAKAKLRVEATISKAAARMTVEMAVPRGRIESAELECENGKLTYAFDSQVPRNSGIEKVNTDAMTGTIIAHEHESPKAEKKEAAVEAKAQRPNRP